MLVTATQQQVKGPNIFFIDKHNEIVSEQIEAISSNMKQGSITRNNLLPKNVSDHDLVFYYVSEYSRPTVRSIVTVCEEWQEKKKGFLVLVHNDLRETKVIPYLTLPVNGIVSLSFLEKNSGIVFQFLKQKGVFLEPTLHQALIAEIEKQKLKDKPIKKLILKRETVKLTENEKDVLQLILDGYNNRQISDKLYLAPSTISTIISQLLRKIEAKDRTDAMVKSIRYGWVEAAR
ncbi:response regulator transcription factor [Evansella sp. AB-rgal1]|uniref:response regulator transcription factor n=1 Tax=Evansella sp. AB-rgal1 TaxID=3242696 RepID=UPI00359D53F9